MNIADKVVKLVPRKDGYVDQAIEAYDPFENHRSMLLFCAGFLDSGGVEISLNVLIPKDSKTRESLPFQNGAAYVELYSGKCRMCGMPK